MNKEEFEKIFKKEIEKINKELKNDKANANANRNGNSEQSIRENDEGRFGEFSNSSSLSNGQGYEQYSTLVTGRFSNNLQELKFKRELSESLKRNSDEPRNTAQSRFSGAESRFSGAESKRSSAIKSTSDNLYKFNDKEISNKLSKEENKEFKDYIADLRKQTLLSYTKNENITKDILELQNDLKYYIKKNKILTLCCLWKNIFVFIWF